jgi:hypothetical protein
MTPLHDERLIGFGRDDAKDYVDWIRHDIREIPAHIPYEARNNSEAIQKLESLSENNAALDFITTDIVNVYSNDYQEGIEFVRQIRSLSDDILISRGLRLRHIPMLVFTGGGYQPTNVESIKQIDPNIPVIPKHAPDGLARSLVTAVSRYRHNVLADFQNNGLAVFWEGGRLRLGGAYNLPVNVNSKYYSSVGQRFSSAYSRLILITGTPRISDLALEEFEDLLNSQSTRERDFQSLFERHPEFLLGDEYDSYWAEPRFTSPSDGRSIRPDFVLQPLALRSNSWRWNVVDLKRHDVELLIAKRFHIDLSRHIYRAATQLRDYAEFFADPRNSEIIRQRFGGIVPNPQLTMVIGRLPESDRAEFNRLQNRVAGVHIRTYEDLLQFRRARVEQLRYRGR